MKKRIAALLCAVLVLTASGCGAEEVKSVSGTTAVPASESLPGSVESFADRVRSDGYNTELLPADFPRRLPAGAVPVTTVRFYRDDKSFDCNCDFTRVRFRGTKAVIAAFGASLEKSGWCGGCIFREAENPGDRTGNAGGWFEGFWRKGSTAALIDPNGFYYDPVLEDAPYTVSIDVVDTPVPFPAELENYVPAFNGVRAGRGSVQAFGKSGEKVESPKNLEGLTWLWELSRSGCFIGIGRAQALSYINGALAEAGFDCTVKNGEDGYGKFILASGTAEVNGESIFVEVFYAEYLSTLSITATNNYGYFPAIKDENG